MKPSSADAPRLFLIRLLPLACLALLPGASSFAQGTERASLDPAGAPFFAANTSLDIDDSGSLLCFRATPFGGSIGLYVRDLVADATTLLSTAVSYQTAISGDGDFVVAASNHAAPGDTNGTNDIYGWPSGGGTPIWVSTTAAGGVPNVPSWDPDISESGEAVVFSANSAGPNSVPSNMTSNPVPVSSQQQVYLRRFLPTSVPTRLISVTPTGSGGNGASSFPRVSDTGRFVAFQSDATDLVAGDANGTREVFVWDDLLGTLTLVSRSDAGVQANGNSSQPKISADGRFILYRSLATNLAPGVPQGSELLYLLDRDPDGNGDPADTNGVTSVVSLNSLGERVYNGFLGSWPTDLSDDASQVLFARVGTGLTPNNSPPLLHVWLRASGQTTNVHVDAAGHPGNASAEAWLALAGDGSRAAYLTNATNLAPPDTPDTNGQLDVYAHSPCENPARELGFWLAGTGGRSPEFSVCGGLGPGETAQFRLRQALPGTLALLRLSSTAVNLPFCGSTIVPSAGWIGFAPPVVVGAPPPPLPFLHPWLETTNALGDANLTFGGGGGPFDMYGQWIVVDPGGCRGVALSNALLIRWDP